MSDSLKSTLTVAVVTAGMTILGTYAAGLSEYGAQTKLERQKFEYSLIEKSLVSDEGSFIGNEETSRSEASRRLEFLIDTGVITTLNTEAIRRAAENPRDLPTLQSRDSTSFSCRSNSEGVPTMFVETLRGTFPVIEFSSDFPEPYTSEKRCNEVSARFQISYDRGELNYLRTFNMGGQPVLCAADTTSECKAILLTLPSWIDAKEALESIVNVRNSAGEPLQL